MHCSKEHCLFTYLIFKSLLYCVASSSLPYSSRQIPLLVSRERKRKRVEKQCIKGKQILLCERLLNELKNTVWNIIIFIKQDLPDACFRCHVDDIEILREFAWLRSNRRNLCQFGGLENFLRHPLERQIIRILQIHKEENEGPMLCQKFVGWI